MSVFAGVLGRPFDILLEILEAKPVAIAEAAIEGPFDQDFEFAQAEHRDGGLPALPDKAMRLGSNFVEGIAEKSGDQGPIQFPSHHQHGERLAHAGPDVLFGIRVEDDLVERLRIAIEDRRDDAMGGARDAVAEDRIDFVLRTFRQACQRSVGGFLSPLAEQMEDEEQRRRLRTVGRVERQIGIDFAKEPSRHVARMPPAAPPLASPQRGLAGRGPINLKGQFLKRVWVAFE